MAQWSVAGAEKASGKETTLLVEAPTEELAKKVAKERGILVASVAPAHEAALDAGPSLAVALAYQATAARGNGKTPSALLWASRACFVIAVLGYAAVLAAMVFNALAANSGFPAPAMQLVSRFVAGIISVMPVAFGSAAAHVASALLLVLRDRLGRPAQP